MMKNVSYAQAIKRKYPEAVYLVTTIDSKGVPNVLPIGWEMLTSVHPPMMAIAVAHRNYSHELIRQTGEFVICFPGEDLVDEVLFCGAHSGRDTDKFAGCGLTPLPPAKVKPPVIAECLAAFECVLVKELDTGDHSIFVGEVVASHISDKPLRRLCSLGNGMLGGL